MLIMPLKTVNANRDYIVGLKVRMEPDMLAGNGEEVLKRVRTAADRIGLLCHVFTSEKPLHLWSVSWKSPGPGDVITHAFPFPPRWHPRFKRSHHTGGSSGGCPGGDL